MPAIFVPVLGASGSSEAVVYDLLLKNGHVIDIKNNRNGRFDIAVVGNRIYQVAANLSPSRAKKIVDVSEYYVTPGLIDIHTHLDAHGAWLNLTPDHNALRHGVTTAVDAGSSGWKGFEDFKIKTIDRARTRVLAFLNIVGFSMSSKVGVDDSEMDVEAAVRMVKKYPDIIVGIRATAHGSTGGEAIDRAIKAAEMSNSLLMVDIGEGARPSYEDLITTHMRPGDIYTHLYERLTPQLDENKKVQSYMWRGRQRGILFDVGHGSAGFWFRIAVPMIQQGFLPNTISTDMDKDSIMLPRTTLVNVMSKFLNIGLTLDQVIERTTVKPAKAIRRAELGTLDEGAVADIAVLKLERGEFGFLDSGHGKLIGDKNLRCALTVRNGRIVWDSDGLSLTEWTNAGPYTNFR